MKKEPKTDIDPSLIEEAMEAVEKHGKGKESHSSKRLSDDPAGAVEKKPSDISAEEALDRFIRVTADFDNFRKRVQKEKSELLLYGNENLMREIVPVLDNFERAVEHAEKTTDVVAMRKGVELILSQLKTVLNRFGVRSESAKGKKFDPLVHEAVSHVTSKDQEPNTVTEEHQKAYFLHQRLIRPALVTVAKGDDAAEKVTAPNAPPAVAETENLEQDSETSPEDTPHGEDNRN